jgi:ATP-dependent exoDNAse (exonuclease V) beta subunit
LTRLFYVALTRARRAAVLITDPRRMSPFVIELLNDPHVTVARTGDAPVEIWPRVRSGQAGPAQRQVRPLPGLLGLPGLHVHPRRAAPAAGRPSSYPETVLTSQDSKRLDVRR